MIDDAIRSFITKRKKEWLKKKIKSTTPQEDKERLESEAEEIFDLSNWLVNAAKRAGQMSVSTHPCTFSHPSSRKNKNGYATPIVAYADFDDDGLLRSGNVEIEEDALGNAAVIDVYKFLTLELSDGKKLLYHLNEETQKAKELLKVVGEKYEEVRNGLLSMLHHNASQEVTSSKIKQVYFEVDDDSYHLLSILTPSGIIFKLKEKIDDIRFSERSKNLRDVRRNGECVDEVLMDIPNLTMISFGGTKPQNISVLNNQNGGRAYLLRSMPPALKKRNVRFPKKDFFKESLYWGAFVDDFDAIVKLAMTDYNNVRIREGRKRRYRLIIETIIERMWEIRTVADEQYFPEHSLLPSWQKMWLLPGEQKEGDDDWLDEVIVSIVRWMVAQIERKVSEAFLLGPEERNDIEKIVIEYKEALR